MKGWTESVMDDVGLLSMGKTMCDRNVYMRL